MHYIHAEDTMAGRGERALVKALAHNSRTGLSLAYSQTLELLFDALCALRDQSHRALADDLRRAGDLRLASELERQGQCGPWVDGHRWRVADSYMLRVDVDPTPNDPSKRWVDADDLRPLLALKYTGTKVRPIPADQRAALEAKGLTPRQAEGAPWVGWFLPGGDLVAVVAPMKEDDDA